MKVKGKVKTKEKKENGKLKEEKNEINVITNFFFSRVFSKETKKVLNFLFFTVFNLIN